MPAQSSPSAGAVPADRAPLGWLILIPLGCLVLLQALFAWHDFVPVLDGGLADSDAYARMVRVQDLYAGGDWFDARLARVNPPEGHVQHWTRALDALLLAGGWLLKPWLGFERGLYLWGVLISPVLLALALITLSWAAAPALGREARLFACIALLTQPTVLAYTCIGRPDHHSLLLLLCLLLLGLTVRLALAPGDRRTAVLAGLVAALSIWISPESLTFIGASLAALGLFWLGGSAGLAAAQRTYLLAATAGLAVALGLERGPDWLTLENDRLSLVHVTLFGLLAAFWMLVGAGVRGPRLEDRAAATATRYPKPFSKPRRPPRGGAGALVGRLASGTVGLAAIALLMALLFPDLRQGPLGPVDPLYARVRLDHIVEAQPLLRPNWLAAGQQAQALERVIKVLGIALFALPWLLVLLIRSPGPSRKFWVTVALALSVFLPLTFYQVRWATYLEALLVWPYAAFVAWLLARVSAATGRAACWLRPPLLAGALLWALLVSAALSPQQVETAGGACPLDRLAPVLNRAAGEPRTILAYADYGAELLYRTGHRVLSIPNHRLQPGFTATWQALTATAEEPARRTLEGFGVDWILLCPSPVEQAIFAPDQPSAPTLYQRLVKGDLPGWLRAVPLEGDLAQAARLFEVTRSDLAAAPAATTTR